MDKAKISLVILLGLQFLVPTSGYGEQPYKAFKADQYSAKEFKVSQRHIKHGSITIEISQAKKLINFIEAPHHCRAWLNMANSKKKIIQRYYDDIDPSGFSFGLFVPKVQPPSPYFAIIKNGDYDGRLFLIRTDGKVHDLMGGFYFITKISRYLFSQYASDMAGLVVFDLKTDRVVFSSDNLPYIHQWYTDGNNYFFSESAWLKNNFGKPTAKEGVVYFYDFSSHQIIPTEITAATKATAKPVLFDFNPREYNDCISEPASKAHGALLP